MTDGKLIDIPTPDGAMGTYVARRSDEIRPLVIVFMDVWGARPQLFEIAERIAERGYCAVVPNLYYRDGVKSFDFRDSHGRTLSMTELTDEQRASVRKHSLAITHAAVDSDVGAILEFLYPSVSQGPAGSVGFCLGGRLGLYVAGTRPERMRATASLHGTFLVNDKADSPHRLAHRLRGEIYCAFAEHDEWVGPDVITTLDRMIGENAHVTYKQVIHPGTTHGYSIPDRNVYNEAAAERDWIAIFSMFERQLSGKN